MNCQETCELLYQYHFDLLEPGQSRRVAEHLRSCLRCSRELEGLRRVLDAWGETPVPPGLTERALSGVEAVPEPGPVEVPHLGWHRAAWWLAAAGVLAAVVLGAAGLHLAGLRPSRQDTVLVAPRRFLLPGPMSAAAGRAAVRVMVRTGGPTDWFPVAQAQGTLDLVERASGRPFYHLGSFTTEASGSAPVGFPLRGLLLEADRTRSDRYLLALKAVSEHGADWVTVPVVLQRAYRLLLETDQPVYRPGQRVRLRGVLLDEQALQPQPDASVTVRLLDARGRTLATRETASDHWGLFGAELALPRDLTPGTYDLVASSAESASQRPVRVVEAPLSDPGGPGVELHLRPRRPWYRPGDQVQVDLRARGPRGGPLSGARLEVRAAAAGWPLGPASTAETDPRGEATVSLTLPQVLPAGAVEGSAAAVRLEARLRLKGKVVAVGEAFVGVAREPLRVAVWPEAGVPVPGLQNLLYVLVTRPDGSPAPARLTLRTRTGLELQADTDRLGLAVLTLTPTDSGLEGTLTVEDEAGYSRRVTVNLPVPSPAPRVLVRPERWYVPGGEPIRVTVLGPPEAPWALLDVSVNGQLALTESAALRDGVGHLSVALPGGEADFAGIVELRGYLPGEAGPAGSVSRRVGVGPARRVALRAELAGPGGAAGRGPRLRLTLPDFRGREQPPWFSVSASTVPAGLEPEPSRWVSRYLLGEAAGPEQALRNWLQPHALSYLIGKDGGGAPPPGADRLALALLGVGSRLLPQASVAAGDPQRGFEVRRTYPEKLAAVARTQARFVPPVRAGLWTVSGGLLVIGLVSLMVGLWRVKEGGWGWGVLQAGLCWGVAAAVAFAVLPRLGSPQAYRQAAAEAASQARPQVLVPAPTPGLAPEEAPLSLPRPQFAGTLPRTLLWEPAVQANPQGVLELELPETPSGGRLRVSVLALVPTETGGYTLSGATFLLDRETPPRTVALLPYRLMEGLALPR